MSESNHLEITPAGQEGDPVGADQIAAWQGHARLEWQAEGLSVTDLGGPQPLVVNGVLQDLDLLVRTILCLPQIIMLLHLILVMDLQ